MGPQLLIDKSAIQSFSSREATLAHVYFYVVYAPTLFIEILGDIKKHGDDLEKARREVAKSNGKLTQVDSSYTCHYRIAVAANLQGNPVPMDGRPLKLGGQHIATEDGRNVVFFDEEPELEAHRRWESGEFKEAEEQLADRWRQSTRAVDLEVWVRGAADLPKANSISEAKEVAIAITKDAGRQLENLQFLLSCARFDEAQRNLIVQRWLDYGLPNLEEYAPYAYWCLVAFLTFYICVANTLVGTRATNLVDLEYVLYLPFSKYFTSGDRFHRDFVPHFLSSDQGFIDAVELKADLKRIDEYFDAMSDKDREIYRRTNGPYPPELEGSVVNDAWVRHAKPRETYQHIEITPEVNDKLLEHLKPMMDAIRDRRKN